MSFLEKALDAPILRIGAMPSHLLDATDAGFLKKSQQKLELKKPAKTRIKKAIHPGSPTTLRTP